MENNKTTKNSYAYCKRQKVMKTLKSYVLKYLKYGKFYIWLKLFVRKICNYKEIAKKTFILDKRQERINSVSNRVRAFNQDIKVSISPKVSIIIDATKGTHLQRCLNYIKANTLYENVEFIIIGKNDKQINNLNTAIKQSTGQYIVVLKENLRPLYGWLTQLIAYYEKNDEPTIGIAHVKSCDVLYTHLIELTQNEYVTYASDEVECLIMPKQLYEMCGAFEEELEVSESLKRYIVKAKGNQIQCVNICKSLIMSQEALKQGKCSGEINKNTGLKKHIAFLVTEAHPRTLAGDFFSAHSLGEALKEQFGYEVSYIPRRPVYEWGIIPQEIDCIISMLEDMDLRSIHVPQHTIKLAWVRGHIDEWCANKSLSKFDGILTTSEIASKKIEKYVGKEKIWGIIPLAVPRSINKVSTSRDIDVSFVGNIYGVPRKIVECLEPNDDFKFEFYGDLRDKEKHPWKAYHQGTVKHTELKEIYSRSKIVIEDIAPFNEGTVNLRVFEAAACGALVIGNESAGLRELFGEEMILYKDKEDLNKKIKFYLEHEDLRQEKAKSFEQYILKQHTFKERAEAFHKIFLSKDKEVRDGK